MSNGAADILFHPGRPARDFADPRSAELIERTVQWFESRGKDKLLQAYFDAEWYDDFLAFVKQERLFASLCTPEGFGIDGARWDTFRNSAFAEVLGFYGLQYWYTWQVSVLGLGPLWMTENRPARDKTVEAIDSGGIFAFGLSEKQHGADIYSSSMKLEPQPDGTYRANGSKYYIGNGNEASIVSVFGKLTDSGDYVFFMADPKHASYHLKKNVVHGQSYVAEFELRDYPITEADILHRGQEAWDAALNTVNIGKYNLGWASIGICTHALYEAIHHAGHRSLYKMMVTDFPHVKRLFVDAYARLVAMKSFALRASDYMRSASADDRRYLLFNPMVKMKVTTEGEKCIDALWDVIAAKGFENDVHFTECATSIRALPKLEGTVHVNIALIVKFMANYFFAPADDLPDVPSRSDASDDTFLFHQGPTRGLSKIRFHDYRKAFELFDTPNVSIFKRQIDRFKSMLMSSPPTPEQMKDTDFLLAGGQIFATVVYGQLFLEQADLQGLDNDVVDQVFDVLIRDVSAYAVEMQALPAANDAQVEACRGLVERPSVDAERFGRMWSRVHELRDAYQMPA